MCEVRGELAVCGLFSCGGDAIRHSSREPRLLERAEAPLPNLNVGSEFSALIVLRETDVVDDPLARAREGLSIEDRLRLFQQESALSVLNSTCSHTP